MKATPREVWGLGSSLGLIPFLEFLPGGSGTITGNFAVTGALALITFVAIIIAAGAYIVWRKVKKGK